MNSTKPACGHEVLRPECKDCKSLLEHWYSKLRASDPDWRDIEYGLDSPELIYHPAEAVAIDPESSAYYDLVMAVYHSWTKEGRSKRDCLVAELLAKQDGDTGTERGISKVLRSKRLRPFSRFMVRRTIKEINSLIPKIAQPHLSVEQRPKALRPMDSKPLKEEASGQTKQDPSAYPGSYSRAA